MNTPINQVTINANLVENPELHFTQNGNPVTTFRVAQTNRSTTEAKAEAPCF